MKIALLGDIALYDKFCVNHNPNIDKYFKDISTMLSKYDIVVGNLETPFSISKKTYGAKSAYISANPQSVDILQMLNIGVVNLANNHIFDFGAADYLLTKEILDQNNIKYFGTENNQYFVEQDGNKLAFSGFCCYSTNPLGLVSDDSVGVNELNVLRVANTIKSNHERGYYNIVSLHTGQEHVNYPNYDTIKMAKHLSKVANYTFYGHHPHVAQAVQKINGSLIAYSLGNFCFDDVYSKNGKDVLVKLSENNKSSFILELNIENNAIVSYQTIPIYIGEDRMIVGEGATKDKLEEYTRAIELMSESEYQKMRSTILNNYIASRKKARNLMWYLKRMRPRYVNMILASRNNAKKYAQSVKQFL